MAKLRIFNTIDNDVYSVQIDQDRTALSDTDKTFIKKFGEPTVNLGGTFLPDSGNTYTLPAQYVKVVSGLPVTMKFDSTTAPFNTATVTKVNQFVTDTITKFTDAFTTLRANTDTFSGEIVSNI